MPKLTTLRRILAASLVVLLAGAVMPAAETKKAADPQLAHSVIFTLKDQSAKSREAFVVICDKYLTSHKGAVSYTCGTIAEDVKEGASDREFDVALHVVFEDKAALAEYLKSERHNQFVAQIKDKIAKVRVFDSYLPGKVASSQ